MTLTAEIRDTCYCCRCALVIGCTVLRSSTNKSNLLPPTQQQAVCTSFPLVEEELMFMQLSVWWVLAVKASLDDHVSNTYATAVACTHLT